MLDHRARTAALALCFSGFGSTPLAALQIAPPDGDQLADPPGHLEKPDDPPGDRPEHPPTAPPRNPLSPVGVQIIQVNTDEARMNILNDAANEPSIAVDPTDPDNMAIGWRQFDTVNSNFRQAGWAFTTDGGQTWTFPGRIEAGTFRSDPVLDVDQSGRFYYYSLRSNFLTDFFLSDDGGETWGPRIPAFGGDKQWFTIDNSGGVGEGNVYGTWSVNAGCCGLRAFIRSTDGLDTVEEPIQVPLTPIWGAMDVGPDGALFITGIEPGNSSNFVVARSMNAQDPDESPVFEHVAVVDLDGRMTAFADPNPAGLLGQAWVAADPSRPGNVYLFCTVDRPGQGLELDAMFARSTDNGETWSDPVRVNSVPAGQQWMGTMSVAPSGRIDAVWLDTRNDDSATFSELFYAFSTDGGVTWSDDVSLSPPFNHFLGYPQQNKMGDYFDMTSRNDAAYLAWAATFNGEQDVYFTRIPAPGSSAELDGFDVTTGTVLDGDINSLRESDDDWLHTRSGFGRLLADLHKLEMIVNAATTEDDATSLDFTIEARIDEPAGAARVSLRNRTTGEFDVIGTYDIGMTDEAVTFPDLDATTYIDAGGAIELRTRHVVFVPFLAFNFESFIDQIDLQVR